MLPPLVMRSSVLRHSGKYDAENIPRRLLISTPRGNQHVTIEPGSAKNNTSMCIKIKWDKLKRGTLPVELYLTNVATTASEERDDRVSKLVREEFGTDSEFIVEFVADDPESPESAHYCLVPKNTHTTKQRIERALMHMDKYFPPEHLATGVYHRRPGAALETGSFDGASLEDELESQRDVTESLGDRRMADFIAFYRDHFTKLLGEM